MKNLKKFEEMTFDDFERWNQKWNPVTKMNNFIKRSIVNKVSGKNRIEKEIKKNRKEISFTMDDINSIKDLFFEIQEKFSLEEDIDGKILDYIEGNTNRKRREMPQFFIEDNNGFLIFGIASDKNFITDELVSEIDSFKLRLQRFKYKCGENTIKYKRNIVPWMEYLYFYIYKN